MLTIPTLDIGVTSRAFLQDHRRKSYLQPINWSVLSSGDTPYVEPMETDDNGGAPEPGGVYGTSSSHLIGGNSTHSLSRAEFHSLHLHLEESELLDEEEEDVGTAPDPTTPVHSTPIGPRPTTQSRHRAKQPKHLTRRQRRRNVFGHDVNDLRAMRQLQLVIPRFQNRGTWCWANSSLVAVLAVLNHTYGQQGIPDPMEGDGTFVPQFLALLNSASEIVNPLNLLRSLAREHLSALNDYDGIMTQYQG